MAVFKTQLTFANSSAGRIAGNHVKFYCDTEAELPTTNVIDGDFALALDTGKPFTRVAGVWDLNTAIDVVAVRILETGGPTSLLIGAINDGQTLVRSGTDLIGISLLRYVEVTADYDVLLTDKTLNVTAGVSISLLTAVGITGQNFVIKNSTTGNVKILPFGGETIDGVAGTMDTTPLEVISLTSDGANWIRV